MITTIFFDAGDTLLYVANRWEDRAADAARSLGISATPEDLGRARDAAREWSRSLPWPYAGTTDQELAYWQRYYEVLLSDLGVEDPKGRLRDAFHQQVWWVPHTQLFADVGPTLTSLRALGVRLGVISNAYASMQEALDHLDLTRYFDTITISDAVGITKPDPAIYQHALETAGVAAGEAAFVDDLVENVETADRLGMTGLLIDRNNRYPDAPVRRIRDLAAVVALVEDTRPIRR